MLGGQTQFLQGAEHPVGLYAPELAPLDLHTAGEQGIVLCHGDQIAHVDIPRAGDDLDGAVAYVKLQNPHVVGVLVLLHLNDFAHHHVFHAGAQVGGDLLFGPGKRHRLREVPVGSVHFHKFIQPFSGQ
ncbi:hypothetical protein SDC9_95379 [bioreactor metagenome]|uniref:Uncharacterized protein n=1 Tax=bioreactor metagenome TaxID=1076179 RepID=A0A645ACS6_9ZZZZ